MTHSTKESVNAYDLLRANLWLAGFKFLAVFPTQPLQNIMRWQQAVLQSEQARRLSIIGAIKEIKNGQSYRSFFRGSMMAGGKEFFKNITYKGVVIKGAPVMADRVLPDSFKSMASGNQYHIVQSLVAGFIAGAADNLFGGAFETIATFQATSHGKYAKESFYQEIKQQKNASALVKRLYRGFIPATVKSTVAFGTFFTTAPYIKTGIAKAYNLENNQSMPWHGFFITALLTGSTVAFASAPWDIVKTQAQMPGAKGGNMLQVLKNNYKEHGIKGATTGLGAKAAMIIIGWSLTYLATTDRQKTASTEEEVSTAAKKLY